MSSTGGSFCAPAVYRSYSALVRSSSRTSTLRRAVVFRSALRAQFQEILLGNGVAFWEGTIAGQREASGEC